MAKNDILSGRASDQMACPNSIRDAFRTLDAILSPNTKDQLRMQTREEFATSQHFGLGLWVRNVWYYGADERTRKRLFGKTTLHLDNASSEFLKRYYDHLKNQKNDN